MTRFRLVLVLAAALCACSASVQAPTDAGVCWHMVRDAKGETGGQAVAGYRFFVVGRNVKDLEHCAAALDAMRSRFLALGGSARDLAGAYQGEFLFLDARGAFAATSLEGAPFPLLRRSDDGHLVPPNAPIAPDNQP